MKKVARQIAVLFGLLLLVCGVCRLSTGNVYESRMPAAAARSGMRPQDLRVSVDRSEVAEQDALEVGEGYVRVRIRPRKAGVAQVEIHDQAGESLVANRYRVGRLMTVYDTATGGFTGDKVVLVAFTVFCLAVAAIMYRYFWQAKGPAFYGYATIYAAGFALFALLTGLLMLYVTARHLRRPYDYSMRSAYSAISGASFTFVLATTPLMLAFAAAMAVSNIALLRHERFRPQNLLGIGVAVALALGDGAALLLFRRSFSGPAWQMRLRSTLGNVYATVFAYFECMLIGAIVCGLKAARHVPAMDVDYILILGCRFRKDGTLTPLLQGRVDRAVEFWRDQKAATGREAVLMPSGGQGPDEVIPEAEAMRRYLAAQGIPERAIRPEDRSRNTYQNMEFSKALIDAEKPGAKVAYATTNYHVFRSGVWAALAGLPAEGMGSRTKWWYWPNAFMRECAGLLMNRVPQELLLLAVLLALFGLLSMVLI